MNTPAPSSGGPANDGSSTIERWGLAPGQIVQEFGYDDDADPGLREAIEDIVSGPMEDEDYTGETDVALLWWRGDDGDVTDALVDLVGVLAEGGFVVLLTPRPGRGVEVEVSEIEEAAGAAGLHSSGSANVTADWRATKLVAARTAGRR